MLLGVRQHFTSPSGIVATTAAAIDHLLDGDTPTTESGNGTTSNPIAIEVGSADRGQSSMSTLNPTSILDNGVVTSSHVAHQARKNPSAGVDIDDATLSEGSQAPVRSPVSGRVTLSGGSYGTVEIVDSAGNRHRLLHLSDTTVAVGSEVQAGDQIGNLGNTVPSGSTPVRDHVHYQIQDANGDFVDPEQFNFAPR